MCEFNKLEVSEKLVISNQMRSLADSIGGKRVFFEMMEAIKATKPTALAAKNKEIRFEDGTIKWEKVIYGETLNVLNNRLTKMSQSGELSLLPHQSDKQYKNVLNMLRALGSIEFKFSPKNKKDGDGFILKPFEIVDERTTKLNKSFELIFFCSLELMKKVLNFEENIKEIK